jgi:hypothetical protein
MDRIRFILTFIIVTFTSCGSSDNEATLPNTENHPIQQKATLIGEYKTKPPKELFFADRWLKLNEDSTFRYRCWTCDGIDTCYGNWNFSNSMITLNTSKELRREIDVRNVLNSIRLVDLNNHHILISPDYLLLQTYGNDLDTLVKK